MSIKKRIRKISKFSPTSDNLNITHQKLVLVHYVNHDSLIHGKNVKH